MPVFLFLKQIVDMLYQYKILDYGMVLFAVALIAVKLYKEKFTWKDLRPADYAAAGLSVLFTVSFLREPSGYAAYFKILSGFLIYFLGRAYGGDLMKHGRWLSAASYLIVYLNLGHRLVRQGFVLFLPASRETELNHGEFYYYKTDMAIAMIIAVLFIYIFSEIQWLKWLTIGAACSYMVFYSGARMQMVILLLIYFLLILSLVERKTGKEFKLDWKLAAGTLGIVAAGIAILALIPQIPGFRERIGGSFGLDFSEGLFSEKIMHSRNIIWLDILKYFSGQPFLTQAFGVDLATESLRNSAGAASHSLYIHILYAIGYAGAALFIAFGVLTVAALRRIRDRKLFYLTLGLWIMYLAGGVTIAVIDLTQFSWFPMLFAGAVITQSQAERQGLG